MRQQIMDFILREGMTPDQALAAYRASITTRRPVHGHGTDRQLVPVSKQGSQWGMVERECQERPYSACQLSPPFMRRKRQFRMAHILDNAQHGGKAVEREALRERLTDPVAAHEQRTGRILGKAHAFNVKAQRRHDKLTTSAWR